MVIITGFLKHLKLLKPVFLALNQFYKDFTFIYILLLHRILTQVLQTIYNRKMIKKIRYYNWFFNGFKIV